MQRLELDDIQGIVAYAFALRPSALYLLLSLREGRRDDAAQWLRELLPRVPSAEGMQRERAREFHARDGEPVLSIAFTYPGLQALGLPESAARSLVPELRQGMSHPHRSRVLGDLNTQRWEWGGPTKIPHLLLAVFDRSPDALAGWLSRHLPDTAPFALQRCVRASLPRPFVEPFGFRDGISQPDVPGLRSTAAGAGTPCNRVAAGEFVLGYHNQNGRTPASPWVRDADDPQQLLPAVAPGFRDLGRNGSFLVAREFAQDVRAFGKLPGAVQAKLMGRWHGGAPLALSPGADRHELATANDFGYFDDDRQGLKCPLGAHVRRANPRDALANPERGVSPEAAGAASNQHRILRRGRRIEAENGTSTGLFFVCLNTNIERQFEFIQQSWLMNPGFAGLSGELDIASGRPTSLTLGHEGPRQRVSLDAYVQVLGGGYFFLPGLRALRYLTR